eukprot:501700_1
MKAMMILASVMSKAAGHNLPENNRAAALICADLTRRYPAFLSNSLEGNLKDNVALGEYMRLCPGDIYDPFLDYMVEYGTECGEWDACIEACNSSTYGPCADGGTVGGMSWASLEKLNELASLWKRFRESDVPEENQMDWEMSLEDFMLNDLDAKNVVYPPQNPEAVIESGICCDDDDFKMEEKEDCLGDADADGEYFYTGQYPKDFFGDAYQWSGAPGPVLKKANEYLNDMFDGSYNMVANRYNKGAMLEPIVDTMGARPAPTKSCSLNDLVYPEDGDLSGEHCAARSNFCVSNTMRGALTRRHCPNTCNKYILAQGFYSTMWSPASYANCRRWCADAEGRPVDGGGTATTVDTGGGPIEETTTVDTGGGPIEETTTVGTGGGPIEETTTVGTGGGPVGLVPTTT